MKQQDPGVSAAGITGLTALRPFYTVVDNLFCSTFVEKKSPTQNRLGCEKDVGLGDL